MNISSKKIWLVVALPAAVGMVAIMCWATLTHEPAQIITFPNGDQYRFVAATWGTNHSQPRLLAHIIDHLPTTLAASVRAKLGPRFGLAAPLHTDPSLVVWFEMVRTNPANRFVYTFFFNAMLADGNGVQSGMSRSWYLRSPGWACAEFTEVPRRSRMLEFQPLGLPASGRDEGVVSVRFRNPSFEHFPQWQPEPLPVEKLAGDLRVQLTSFATRSDPRGDGHERDTVFSLTIGSPRPGERWVASPYELSDATGNRFAWDPPDIASNGFYSIFGALWPEEPALRLKLGLKRVSGFSAAELFTFTNLPLPRMGGYYFPINPTVLTNVVGGATVEVMNFRNRASDHADLEPESLTAELPNAPPGLAVDVVEVVTEKGEKLTIIPEASSSSSSFLWGFASFPAGAKFLNVTVAVQKERFVEFLAKPTELK